MTPDEESCFRHLMTCAERVQREFDCYCSGDPEKDDGTPMCTLCTLANALDACSIGRRARRAQTEAPTPEERLSKLEELTAQIGSLGRLEQRVAKLSARITTLDDDAVQRLKRLERHVGFVPPEEP